MINEGSADRCPTCHSNTANAAVGNGLPRRAGVAPTDISLLTAIDGAVGHKMRIWSAQKRELEARLETKTKELQTVIAERQMREDALKKEMEEGKQKLEDRLRDLDEQVRTFRAQCESRIKEEQQRSSRLHQELTNEVNQREHELTKAKTRLGESGRTIGVLETERVKLTGELRDSRFQRESLQAKVKELQHEIEMLQSTSQHKMDSVREVEERFQQKAADAEKRALEQERLLTEHVNRIEGLQKALLLARQVQKQTVDDKRKLDEELAKKEYEVKRLTAELDGTKLALTRLTSEHATCACRIADLQKAVNSLKISNTTQTSSSGTAAEKVAEQKTQIAELRRQVTQLGAKLESSRAERNELECRMAEADAAVSRWRETSDSLKGEITRLVKEHNREVNDLKMHISHLESLLQKSTAQEAQLKNQLQQGLSQDTNLQQQLEAARLESNRFRIELSEAHQRIDSLSQERASLFDQLAENGRLRFELEQTRRRLDETAEEAKQFKRLSAELRLRKKAAEERLRGTAPSPTVTVSSSVNTSTGKLPNMPNQAVSLLSAESPTFVGGPPSVISFNNNNQQQQFDAASIGHTTMVSPTFKQIPLTLPSDNNGSNNNNTRRLALSTEPSQISCSSPNLVISEDLRPKSSQSQVTIAETEKSAKEFSTHLPSSILAEWERHSAQEAKSLEVALSSQLSAMTAASEKILSQICALGK